MEDDSQATGLTMVRSSQGWVLGLVWEPGHPAQSPCLSGVPDWPRPKPVVCALWGPGFTLHF